GLELLLDVIPERAAANAEHQVHCFGAPDTVDPGYLHGGGADVEQPELRLINQALPDGERHGGDDGADRERGVAPARVRPRAVRLGGQPAGTNEPRGETRAGGAGDVPLPTRSASPSPPCSRASARNRRAV